MTAAAFAVPGDLGTPTGGYAYARRLLEWSAATPCELVYWPLPGGFPAPDERTVDRAMARLALAPRKWPLMVDGLALGTLPADALKRLENPLIALVHHPLALETGLDDASRARLAESEAAALSAACHVVATSETTARTLAADYGVDPDRITVARPGTEPAPFATGSRDGPVQLLAVGTVTPRKGHDVLLEALAGLDPDLDWRLRIVGALDRDQDAVVALRRQVAAAGLEDRVELAGALHSNAVEAAYDGADLFVLASRYEGYGMVYAEALARGLPVVGTTAGAIPEATLGAATLVAPDDSAALGAALGPLIADGEARGALARRSAEAAERLPRWRDAAEAVARVVARVA